MARREPLSISLATEVIAAVDHYRKALEVEVTRAKAIEALLRDVLKLPKESPQLSLALDAVAGPAGPATRANGNKARAKQQPQPKRTDKVQKHG